MSQSRKGLTEGVKQYFWWLPFGHVPEMSAVELQQRLGDDPPQLLDVRTHAEWARSRIAGAVNVPITALRRRLAGLELDKERPVVAVCLSAHRSVPAVRLLKAHGYQDVRQLGGGMLAWWRRGLPTRSG
jgi:rhodanese-related sulfurtransferase